MALVDEGQVVLREVVEQAGRPRAGGAAGQVARVVLDAVAEAHLAQHLEVVARPHLEPLRLEELPLAPRGRASRSSELRLDSRRSRASSRRAGVAKCEAGKIEIFSSCRFDRLPVIGSIAEILSTVSPKSSIRIRLLFVGWEDLDHVARGRGTCRGRTRRRCGRTGSPRACPGSPRAEISSPTRDLDASAPGSPRARRDRRCRRRRRR